MHQRDSRVEMFNRVIFGIKNYDHRYRGRKAQGNFIELQL